MRNKGIEKLLNIGWGWMVLLLIVFPFIGMLLQFVLLFIELYSENGIEPVPIMMLPILIFMLVYFGWQYVISIRMNRKHLKTPFKTKWFLICLTYILVWTFILTLSVTLPDLFNEVGWFIDRWLYTVIELVMFINLLGLVASYAYLCYFTSKVLTALFKNKEKETWFFESLPYFMTVWVFPFGIPFFNRKIERHFRPKTRTNQQKTKPAFEARTYDEY